MIEQLQLLGHEVVLILDESRPHHYRWAVRIDSRHLVKGRKPLPRNQAREEAMFFARRLLMREEASSWETGTAGALLAERRDQVNARFAPLRFGRLR